MLDTSKQEADLKVLKEFCNQDRVKGFIPNVWFTHLRNIYPWHYIYMSKNRWTTQSKEFHIKKMTMTYENRIKKIIELGVCEEDIEALENIDLVLKLMIEGKER